MFPFSIQYYADIAIPTTDEDRSRVLNYIKTFIEQKSTRKIEIHDDTLSFRSASGLNWDVMSTIEKGVFQVDDHSGHLHITYEFFMYFIFIWGGIMSIFFGLVSQNWLIGIGIFSLLGINWLIALARQRALFDDAMSYIKKADQANWIIR